MNSDTLIIENSHLQGNWRRISQSMITLFFWCLWGYLILPLATPLINFMGIEVAFSHSVDFEVLLNIFITISFLSITMIIVMALWSSYNYLLYLQNQIIQWPLSLVLAKDLAADFNVNILDLTHWQQSRELNIQLNEQGNIQHVKTRYLEQTT